ncbi:S1C family serine protease [Fervidibacillus halotolerans]|uniref:Trypsin-like peptidase domain-containing protein n=1 Tax=Fervidibacillus halotolerans TaxID=2980027 RepID=A0A9E8M310_9BACI|nr:trypsin-like peptidase domain-containing protein [Fervidibacillus halotolerans]WAA13479.1 trypsin-like peptidase domain-containing protein [Fervidibacillus halotolerans]
MSKLDEQNLNKKSEESTEKEMNQKERDESEGIEFSFTKEEEFNQRDEMIERKGEKKDETKEAISSKKNSKGKKSVVKGLMTNVVVGVTSSLLTLSVVSFTDFPRFHDDSSIQAEESAELHLQNSSDAQYTSTFQQTGETTIADIVEEVSPAIVGVVNLQEMQNRFNLETKEVESGSGSGVIFYKDDQYGYIITNNHVIEGASNIKVSLYNGKQVEAEIVGTDALTDMAVLRIDEKYVDKVATFGDSQTLRTGDEVIAIGNPLGLEFSRTVTRGIISGTERTITVETSAGDWELTVLQTDAAINPGNSGGALINSQGEVIGINSLKIAQTEVEGIGFAIPSNDVIPIAEELMKHGAVKRAYLGIQLYNVSDIAEFYRKSLVGSLEKGIFITSVEKGSPADVAGLQENDVIVAINGEEVETATDLRKYLYQQVKPGEKVTLDIYRDGKKQSISVQTGTN